MLPDYTLLFQPSPPYPHLSSSISSFIHFIFPFHIILSFSFSSFSSSMSSSPPPPPCVSTTVGRRAEEWLMEIVHNGSVLTWKIVNIFHFLKYVKPPRPAHRSTGADGGRLRGITFHQSSFLPLRFFLPSENISSQVWVMIPRCNTCRNGIINVY